MPARILDILDGLTMVVSDLHGDRDAFARHTGRFLQFRSRGKVQRLLLLGDLIHSDAPETEDGSIGMIQDVMRMRAQLGPENVIMLLGNHEFVHLYSVMLRKGNFVYTPRFERAMVSSGKRAEIIEFLHGLPFYVRTPAGVSFTHAGPDGSALAMFKTLVNLDHHAILDEFTRRISRETNRAQLRDAYAEAIDPGVPYEVLASSYLGVSGPDDPRFDDLLRGHLITQDSREFGLLWDALFTRCEKSVLLPLYQRLLDRFLKTLSDGAPAPQKVLVTGHIDVIGGHQIVTPHHLRIASAKHAFPRESGEYLLFDPSESISSAQELNSRLGSVYN